MNISKDLTIKILLLFPLWIILVSLLFTKFEPVSSHSGRTDSSGGHYCRTGSCAGTYHYHNSGSVYIPPTTYNYVPPKPSCGSNTYLGTDNKCYCISGYTVGTNNIDCVYLPANAHAVKNTTDAWKCNVGYKEVRNGCEKVIIPSIVPTIINTYNETEDIVSPKGSGEDSSWMWILGFIGLGVWGAIKIAKETFSKNG